MRITRHIVSLFLLFALTSAVVFGRSQAQTGPTGRAGQAQAAQPDIEALKKTAPKIYIDCGSCDIEYIKTEITFVNYVRDRKEADVHLLITTQSTGSGGSEYTLDFSGQNGYSGLDDKLKYFSNKTDTADDIRKGLVRTIKMGLMAYVAKTPISSRIAVSYAEEKKPGAEADKWDSWVFNVSGNGFFNGEKSYRSSSLSGSFSANRVTPDIKIRLGLSASYGDNRYEYGDTIIQSDRESYSFSGLVVKSLNEHWSVGGYLNASSSTYSNIRFDLAPAPAVEYNLFPYSQSTRRQFRILYKVGFRTVRYREETIYLKTSENLWNESLSFTLDVKEKWGAISASLVGSHYFHDFSKNNLNAFATVQLNLVKGLNAYVIGGGSRIRDQLGLVKGQASLEEIILQRRQLETGYSYFFIFGLSYTFGSIYTNVVNPRFGSLGGGGVSIIIN
jgi:hypothetical protein